MSGFSYAQAARGQSIPSSQTSAPTSNTTAATPQATPDKNSENAASVVQNGTTASLALSTTTDSSKASAQTLNHDANASPLKVGSEAPSSPAASSTLAGTTNESTSNFSLDDATVLVASSDKPSRVSTPGTRSPAVDDVARKGGRKGKAAAKAAADKDGSQLAQAEEADNGKEPVKIELAPAPLPTVNIWSQRMIEQAAKVKQSPPVATSGKSTVTTATTSQEKTKDTRKQGNATLGGDAAVDANGTASSGNAKSQTRRLNESTRVGGNDHARRNAPRGARSTDRDEKLTTATRDSLPPVRDAVSWPTPDTATASEEPKSKVPPVDTKVEAPVDPSQEDAGSAKSRKKGWTPLPFVPTVAFQTPLPNVRGSKPKAGNRANRETSSKSSGHNNNNNNSASGAATNGTAPTGTEKASATATVSSPAHKADSDVREATKETNGSTLPSRPSNHTTTSHKRFSTDASHAHPREQRKPSASTLPEKPKETTTDHTATGKSEFALKGAHHNNTHTTAANGDANGQHHQPTPSAHADRRPPYAGKNTSHFNSAAKDFNSQEHKDQHGTNHRERTEPRGERPGRGGFRSGRGGVAGGVTQNSQHIGHSTYQPNGQRLPPNSYNSSAAVLPPTAAPFNPLHQQYSYGGQHKSVRIGGRNASRAQLAAQGPMSFNSRLQNGVSNNPRMHGHATHGVMNGPTEFQPQYPIQAFSPYMDVELVHGLTLQVEYYFSLDNLVKDVFLRRKMNDQGFVPLSVIAKFKRMSELAPSIDFIRAACEQSENLDYVVDQEQNEWIRSRYLWSGFVMPHEDRDEEARKPGPDLRTVLFRSVNRPNQSPYVHPMMNGAYPAMPQQPMFSPPAYPVNSNEMLYQSHDNGVHDYTSPTRGSNTEPNGRPTRSGEIQLSATVPDFSPSGSNGAPTTLEDYQTYPDEQVEKLVVLVGSELDSAATGGELSNQPHVNGSDASGAKSSSDESSDQQATSRKIGEEPYPDMRARALEQRASAKDNEVPATMKHLYRFWSHCLPDKFNVRMYEDFRTFALEDARRGAPNDFGLKCLLQYYDRVLSSSSNAKAYPAVFLPHQEEAKKLSESQASKRVNGDSHA
ncbi:RNA-binding protein Lupus La [Sporothrix schenckii 1099-18]|uniref:RNA-binding protein Lupus La n=1 Tax=Sporothrix schenckii 1099-18 TaxID=1397361 RepID=A0A0F2MH66_SPOSC|nr:RNA-binding protein Lupus La [Sporothrix schenckii 1099-18]KJR88419.1 RNA-binding protein Lupus La [Sporothrix schenckii 1099-18]